MPEINRPIRFEGTDQQKRQNFNTHRWDGWGDSVRICDKCGSKEWHAAAEYPCGVEPPREIVTFDKERNEWIQVKKLSI